MNSRNQLSSSRQCFKEGQEEIRSTCVSHDMHLSVILHIIVKLPIKTAIRCRCVCKAWNKLILDSYFSITYSKRSPFTVMVLSEAGLAPYDNLFLIEIGSNGDVIRTPFFNCPRIRTLGKNKKQNIQERLSGSYNGLLYLTHTPYQWCRSSGTFSMDGGRQTLYLINPLTGEYMKIPNIRGDENLYTYNICGFGSSVDGNYYKVLGILQMVVRILTIGVDDEWRDLDSCPIPSKLCTSGVALNGVLHWPCLKEYSVSSSIYAVDIGKEIGYCIPGPPAMATPDYDKLVELDGNLCLTQRHNFQIDIWTMKQYGVAESWTRDIILLSSIPYHSRHCFPPTTPIATTRNGRLLLFMNCIINPSLISFDPKTKECVKIEKVFDNKDLVYNLFEYVPSFFYLGDMAKVTKKFVKT